MDAQFGFEMLKRRESLPSLAFILIEIEIVYFYSHHMKLTGLDFRT